jgi:hypothetical protein
LCLKDLVLQRYDTLLSVLAFLPDPVCAALSFASDSGGFLLLSLQISEIGLDLFDLPLEHFAFGLRVGLHTALFELDVFLKVLDLVFERVDAGGHGFDIVLPKVSV